MKRTFLIACVLLCAVASASADTVVIAHTGQPVPGGGNGLYQTFTDPVLNYAGQLAFWSDLSGTFGGANDNQGIFLASVGTQTVMCRTNWPTPNGNGRYDELGTPALDLGGRVVFHASARDTLLGDYDSQGIYRSSGGGPGAIDRIARGNQAAPDSNGLFLNLSETPVLRNNGATSFTASFRNTNETSGVVMDNQGMGMMKILARSGQTVPGGDGQYSSFRDLAQGNLGVVFTANLSNTSELSNNRGVYRVDWSNPPSHYELVRKGDPVPEGNGYFDSIFLSPIFNSLSRASFMSQLTGTSGNEYVEGIYLAGTEGVITIARTGQAPPDGNGLYSYLYTTTQGDLRASFTARMQGTSDSPNDTRGIYWGNGLQTHKIARSGEAAVDGNGVFWSFGREISTVGGHTAFRAALAGTVLGSADDDGLYIGDGHDLLNIAREGNMLLGSTITDLYMAEGAECRNGINGKTQVAYRAVLANGNEVLALYTPPIKWKNGNGYWAAEPNWTLSILPDDVYEVTIAPSDGADVIGPRTNASVKSLTIGDVGNLSTLHLVNGGDVSVVNACTVNPSGAIEIGHGRTLTAAAIVNQGRIVIPESAEAWIGGPLDNQGDLEAALDATIHLVDLTGRGCSGDGTVHLGGDLRPGSGVGLMNFDGHAVFEARCTTYIQLDPNSAAPTSDQIVIEGNLILGGAIVVESEFTPAWLTPGQRFGIISVTGRADGQFLGLDEGARVTIFDGMALHITYTGGDGNDVELYAVPEPTTLTLLALGGLSLLRRRRKPLETTNLPSEDA